MPNASLSLRALSFGFVIAMLLGICTSSQPPARARASATRVTANSASAAAQIEYVNGFGGWLGGMAVNGNYAYLAEGSGVVVLDITNADAPTRIARLPLSNRARDLQLVGNRLYINLARALVIADVTQASAPISIGTFSGSDGDIAAMHVVGTQAYISTNGVYDSTSQSYINKGLDILDVGNAAAPTKLGHYETNDSAGAIFVAGNRAYVSHGDAYTSGLYIFDVGNSAKPQLLANHMSPDHANIAVRQVVNTIAYVIQDRGLANTLELVDLSTPTNWNVRGSIALSAAYDLRLIGSRAYVAGRNLDIVDVASITKPVLLGSYQPSYSIVSFEIAGSAAYVVTGNGQFQAIDVSNAAAIVPHGSYLTTPDSLRLAAANNIVYEITDLAQQAPWQNLSIYDTSDPSNAQQLSQTAGISGNGLAAADGYAYVVTNTSLQIIDARNPIKPAVSGKLEFNGQFLSKIVVSNKLAYIASDYALIIADVGDPAHPSTLIVYPLGLGAARHLYITGSRAYVSGIDAIYIFDINDPHSPRLLGSYPVGAFAAAADRNIMYVGSDVFDSTPAGLAGHIDIVNVSDPQHPMLIGRYKLSLVAYDLYIQNSALYILGSKAAGGMVEIADISDPTDPVYITSTLSGWAPNHFVISGDLIYTNSTDGASTNILRVSQASLQQASATITSAGGTLTGGSGRVRLEFPANAVDGQVSVTYQGQGQPAHPAPSGFNLVRAFALAASGANNQPITHFAKPYTLTIDYTDTTLAALGLSEANLNVVFWNGSAWVSLLPCAGCGVDKLNNRVTVVLDHFTDFAFIGSVASSGSKLYLPFIRR